MNALSQITKVSAKDCLIEGDLITFLVKEEEVGEAIGKKAVNVNALQDKLKKRIEIIGWQSEPEKMVSKTLGIEVLNAKVSGNKLTVSMDPINKRKAMASGAKIKRLKNLIKRNFGKELIL